MKLIFTRSPGLVSKIIRRITWHDYSHVALEVNGMVYECNHKDGCITVPYAEWLNQHHGDSIAFVKIQPASQAKVVKRLNRKLGSGYDWLNLLLFPFNIDTSTKHKLICSRYLGWAINADREFFSHTNYHRLAPRHLYLSGYAHAKAKGLS